MIHWSWGVVQTAVMGVVIVMNGHGWRSGWLAGAVAQLVMVAYGFVIYHQWTFLLPLLLAAAFIYNWFKQPARDKARELVAKKKYGWVTINADGTDQIIVMQKQVLHNVAIPAEERIPYPAWEAWQKRMLYNEPWLPSPFDPQRPINDEDGGL